jgi:hypothetical protein
MAAMATTMVVVGGTHNNQPKGAAEKTMAAVTVTVAETMMAMVTAMITMLMPTPTTVH